MGELKVTETEYALLVATTVFFSGKRWGRQLRRPSQPRPAARPPRRALGRGGASTRCVPVTALCPGAPQTARSWGTSGTSRSCRSRSWASSTSTRRSTTRRTPSTSPASSGASRNCAPSTTPTRRCWWRGGQRTPGWPRCSARSGTCSSTRRRRATQRHKRLAPSSALFPPRPAPRSPARAAPATSRPALSARRRLPPLRPLRRRPAEGEPLRWRGASVTRRRLRALPSPPTPWRKESHLNCSCRRAWAAVRCLRSNPRAALGPRGCVR